MSLKKLMDNYATFNLWANTAFVTWLSSRPAAILDKEVPSSYPSIVQTLIHIWNTEVFWLSFLQGNSPVFKDGFQGTSEEALKALLHQSEKFAGYVYALSESELLEICILDQPWMKGQMPRYEFIQHCMNHGTYHRGQIITIGRNIGLTDPPMTDYNYYNLVVKNNY